MARVKPRILVLEGSAEHTGAVNSALALQRLLAPFSTVSIARPSDTKQQPNITFKPALLRRSLPSLMTYPFRSCASAFRLRRLIRGYDVLISNDFYYLEPPLLRLLGFRGRIVTWVRIDPRRYGWAGRVWLTAARWASDEIVAVSDFIQTTLPSDFGAIRIYDAVPTPETVIEPHGQRLLFVGNYVPGKGQDAAISAFHAIAEEWPLADLRFVGGDLGQEENRRYLMRLKRAALDGPGAGRISFGEFVRDPLPELDACLAALNFSESESFSLTCLEASASGRAIIATRCGGPEEIVRDGETGILVDVGDIDAMARAMRALLHDPALARRMGLAGERHARTTFGEKRFVADATRVLLTQVAIS